ncbi:hypothetical protein ACFZCG_30180 [Streptomyces tanashiensis]|uniref:hypothetical protein n=1 Tax=Streptomyces tanashiensis TaxID=67367 RepID=UPI0036EB7578
MIRNIAGSVLALAGATAAVWSPFRAWYDGRHGRDYAVDELFTGITDAKADLLGSILLPFAFAALVTLVGVLLRSRLLVAFAGIVVLGFTILWMVRVGQAEGSLTVGSDGTGLGDGVANAFGGGVLLLLGALVMSGRGHSHRVDRPHGHPRPAPETPSAPPEGPSRPPEGADPSRAADPSGAPDLYAAPDPYGDTRTFEVPTGPPAPDPERENPPPRG